MPAVTSDRRAQSRKLLLAGYLLAQLLFVFVASDAFLVRVDDSYYYFGIARHVVDDGIYSFDGIHLSNGFQPLWQFVLVGITWLAKVLGVTGRHTMPYVFFTVAAGINTLSAWLGLRLADRHFGEGTREAQIASYAALWIPGLTISLNAGMESVVNWPLLLLFFTLLGDDQRRIGLTGMDRRRFLSLVATSVLLVYARLDNAIILAITVLYLAVRDRNLETVKRSAVWGAGTLALWAPLLAWGQKTFASPTPVSGTVKMWNTAHFIEKEGVGTYVVTVVKAFVLSLFGLPASALGMGFYEPVKPLVMRLGFSLVVAAMGIAFLALAALAFKVLRAARPKPRQAPPELLRLLAIVSVVHLLVLVTMFPDQWMYAGLIWYDLVEYLCLFVLVGWLGGWLASSFPEATWARASRVAKVVPAVALVPILLWRPAGPTEGQIHLRAAQWMDENLPPNAVVASHDAGVLGYFTRLPVVNLDGLVNSRSFLDDYLKKGKKKEYLYDAGITHLADIDCPKTPTARFRSMIRIPTEGRIVFTMKGNERDLDFCIVELVREPRP
jgi:hypothetical protein